MALHKDIVNVQVEMLRQFQIQQVSDNLYFISNIIIARRVLALRPKRGGTLGFPARLHTRTKNIC